MGEWEGGVRGPQGVAGGRVKDGGGAGPAEGGPGGGTEGSQEEGRGLPVSCVAGCSDSRI